MVAARIGLVIAMSLVACRDEQPLEKLEAPPAASASVIIRGAPPPPPPPPAPKRTGPPAPIAAVVHGPGATPHVTLYDLAARSGRGFLGHAIERTYRLEPAEALVLIRHLDQREAYLDDGDYGCVGDPLGIHIVRGRATLDLVVDCGHVYLTDRGHEGPFVLLAPEMMELVARLRRIASERARPAAPAIEHPDPRVPAIELRLAGGFRGEELGRTTVWRDGRVDRTGHACTSPRHERIPRAEITLLLTELELTGLFERDPDAKTDCQSAVDSFYEHMIVQTGTHWISLRYDSDCPEWLATAYRTVYAVIGKNPCI